MTGDRSSKGNAFLRWYPELPTEWSTILLRHLLAGALTGNWGEEPGGSELDIPCARIADFDWQRLEIKDESIKTIRSYTSEQVMKLALQNGDLLVEKSGGGEKHPVGSCVQYRGIGGSAFANFAIRLRPNKLVSSDFLRFAFAASYFRGHSWKILNQTTGIQNLDIPTFRSSPIPVPPLQEQEKIVRYLVSKTAEIDGLTEKLMRQRELLERYRHELIARTVTRGIDPDAPMRDSGVQWVGKIPQNWNMVSLKRIMRVKSGAEVLIEVSDGKDAVPVYRSGAKPFKYTNQSILNEAAVVFGCKGTLGIPYLVEPPFWVVDTAYMATPRENVEVTYLYYLLKIFDWKPFLTNTVKPSLVANDILSEKVPLPQRSEQLSILSYLSKETSKIDAIVLNIDKQINLLKQYRKQIINDVVTGKIRVGEVA